MQIGIIGTRGIPNHYGGFEQFAQQLSAGLAEKGHAVYVYNSSLHPYKEKKYGQVHIIHCRDRENRIGTAGQFIYDLNCINDSRRRNFDVLLHLGYTSDSIWHRRWPKNTMHIVNMDGLEWKRSKYNHLTRRFLRWAESLAVKHADSLIADSPGIQQYIMEQYRKESTYIPYGASIFENPDATVLRNYSIEASNYYLLVARMEPENNIEMIIKGYLSSNSSFPLLIIGSTANKYGAQLEKKYSGQQVRFLQAIYDPSILNNMRFFSRLYFHGHSVGGTNPSLLEAMACGCAIVAHDNNFNKAVLEDDADYFSTAKQITALVDAPANKEFRSLRKQANLEKIKNRYNWKTIIEAYEGVMRAGSSPAERI